MQARETGLRVGEWKGVPSRVAGGSGHVWGVGVGSLGDEYGRQDSAVRCLL